MRNLTKIFLLIIASIFGVPIFVFAQESLAPNIAYVYPAGGQRGTKVSIIIGGNKFSDIDKVFIKGGGIKASISKVDIPFTAGSRAQLRTKLEKEFLLANEEMKEKIEAMGKDGQAFLRRETMKIPENRKQMDDADASLYLRELSSDALAETVEVEIEISPEAKLGERTLFVMSPSGISNPMKFVVGDLPEKSKKSLRQTARERTMTEEYRGMAISTLRAQKVFIKPFNNPPINVELPVIVNGQITEGNTDTWSFKAKRGQRIVMSVSAQSLLPYISDAVPGWFQTVILVRDKNGNELAYNDDFHFRPDSHLIFNPPADGEYTVEIFDAVHRGREDFVYRMLIGEVPFVESVYPLGVEKGKPTKIKLIGVNLKNNEMEIVKKNEGDFDLNINGAYHKKIEMMCETREALDFSAGSAGALVQVPSLIDGVMSRKNKVDIYELELLAGEKLVAEVFARRYGSPLDSHISISDSTGKVLASNDDYEDLSRGLVTHHADSRLEFFPKNGGTYYLKIFDTAGNFSNAHSYRLSLSWGNPDFSVVATPSTLNMRNGGSALIKLKAFRKNGYSERIVVRPRNLPKNWTFSGGIIPRDKNEGELIVTSPRDYKKRVSSFTLRAYSKFGKENITHPVVICEDQMQAFYYRHFVPFEKIYACVGNDGEFLKRFDSIIFNTPKSPIRIEIGKKNLFKISDSKKKSASTLLTNLSGTDKVSVKNLYVDKNGTWAVFIPSNNAKVGDKGAANLMLNFRQGRKVFNIGVIGVINFEIVAKSTPKSNPKSKQKPNPPSQNNSQQKKNFPNK